jgi:hypothetical protein
MVLIVARGCDAHAENTEILLDHLVDLAHLLQSSVHKLRLAIVTQTNAVFSHTWFNSSDNLQAISKTLANAACYNSTKLMFSSVTYAVEVLKESCGSSVEAPRALQVIFDGNNTMEWNHGFLHSAREYIDVVHGFGKSTHTLDLMGVTFIMITFGDLMDEFYQHHTLGDILEKSDAIQCSSYDEFPMASIKEALFSETRLCRGGWQYSIGVLNDKY